MAKRFKFNNEIVTTIIGKDTEFKGTMHSQGSIRIEGKLEGEINSQGEVYIGEESKVKANIFGKNVIIAGEVVGNIEAVNGLEICSSGRVYGNISGDRLVIEEGSVYKGKVNMDIISSKNIYEGNLEIVKSA